MFIYVIWINYLYFLMVVNSIGGNRMRWKKIEEKEESDDTSIYSKDARDSLLEDDELSPFEEAFMNGYEDAI